MPSISRNEKSQRRARAEALGGIMSEAPTLDRHLVRAADAAPAMGPACEAVSALASACNELSALAGLGALAGSTHAQTHAQLDRNGDGDAQKELDLRAQDILMRHLRAAPVAAIASEELDDWVLLDAGKPMAVAFDPLDGSANINLNMSIGTIFSILPASGAASPFRAQGLAQIAAGFVVYGPQTVLALTLGAGVDIFTLDRRDQTWRLTGEQVRIPRGAPEYAINASDYRHWEEPVRTFIDDCLNGAEGPRAKNFNMRWTGSLVAEAYRILNRGGVFLYPADLRKGYGEGRLRLLYEAHPIAFIISQAGGLASTGRSRILELAAQNIHQRTPLIFGADDKVLHIEGLHAAPEERADRSPLFNRRGLFRN
jgi:fructose-1,6-bisphosphatase I